jgi:hypothetical protein
MRKHVITPHWFHDSARFWYRNELDDGAREFIAVDAENGVRAPAFDHERLAAGLSKAVGAAVRASHLPFEAIEFVDGAAAVRFRVGEADWHCHLIDQISCLTLTYACDGVAVGVGAAGGRSGDVAAGGGIAGDFDVAVVDFDFGAITEVDGAR